MKKIIAIILCLSFALGMCACTSTKEYENLPSKSEDGHVYIVKAELVNEIHGADGECIMKSSSASAGQIYADVVVYVENMLPTEFDKSAVSGTILYDGTEYEMNYSLENDNCTGVSTDALGAYSAGLLHLFASIPNSALDTSDKIYAKVNIGGETYGTIVSPMDYREPIAKKQELKKGESVSILDGDVVITPISCSVSDMLKTTSSTPVKNKTDNVVIDAVIKIENKMSKESIEGVFGYVMKDSEVTQALVKMESSDNLIFEELGENNAIKPGTTRVVHVYADYSNSGDSMIRINLLGSCFYMKSGS